MAFTKTNWQDRIIERPNTYSVEDNIDGTITLTPVTGVVTQAGTPLSGDNLNTMEDRIGSALEDIAVNAKNVGAKGDGVTDDTIALNNYLGSFSNGKLLLNGTFKISDTLNIPNSNTSIEFTQGSKIVFTKSDRTCIKLIGNNCSISGFGYIDSPAVWYPGSGSTPWSYSIIQVEGNNCSVSEVTINNVPMVGIGIKEVNSITVRNTKVNGNLPIGQFNTSNTVHFGITYNPPALYPSGNIIFEGNRIQGMVEGIFVGNYGSGSTRAFNIINNIISDCYDHGVYAGVGNVGVNITGNSFYNCGNPIAANGEGNIISNNLMECDGLGVVQTFGTTISLREPVGCIVTNNVIKTIAATSTSIINLQTLTGNIISENIISNNTINCGINAVIAIRIVNANSNPITKNNIISNNTIKGCSIANFGLISFAGGNATVSAYYNKIFGNKLTVVGAENISWGIFTSYLKHSEIFNNEILLEYNAPSATVFRFVRLTDSYENIIRANTTICLTGFGTNLTVIAFNESTSDKNEFSNNKIILTSTNLASQTPFSLTSTSISKNRLSDNIMGGTVTISSGTNSVTVTNANILTTSRIGITPINAEAGKKTFYTTISSGSFTIFIGDGTNTTANANYSWEII
jgi:hypothetical protein